MKEVMVLLTLEGVCIRGMLVINLAFLRVGMQF